MAALGVAFFASRHWEAPAEPPSGVLLDAQWVMDSLDGDVFPVLNMNTPVFSLVICITSHRSFDFRQPTHCA